MDHLQFKANQTAATYVAHGLDERTLEAFEMHMMGCKECVEDVETWRTVKLNMPRRGRPALAPAAVGRDAQASVGWRMAASLLVGGILGTAGGWFGHAGQAPDLDSTQTVVFNMPAVERGADECTPLRLAPDTRFAVLRVPRVARERHVILVDSEGRELPASQYSSRVQPDGSHLVRMETQLLQGRAVHLEAKAPDGSGDPLGCVTGQVALSH
jgi:hypothetical protein